MDGGLLDLKRFWFHALCSCLMLAPFGDSSFLYASEAETTIGSSVMLSRSDEGITMTLDDCIQVILEENPTLRASRYALSSAEQDVKMARADFLPSLSASGGYIFLDSVDTSGAADADYVKQQRLDAGLSLSQTLYAGKRITNTYDRAEARTRVIAEERDDMASRLTYRLRVRFFELMKAGEDVIVAEETVKHLEAVLATAEAFFENEMTPYAQVLQARVDLADARQKLGIAENTVERKRSEIFALMNRPYTERVTFSGGLNHYTISFEMDEGACIATGLENRSDLQSLVHQLTVLEKDAAVALGKYLPMVKFSAGFYDQDRDYDHDLVRDQHNTYWSAGMNISWNLFDGGRGWHEREKYHIEMKRIQEQIDEIRAGMESGIRAALFSLAESEARMATTLEGVMAANEYHEREEKRFEAGIATIASVLDAQERLTRARGSHAQALLDYQLVRAELHYLMGGE